MPNADKANAGAWTNQVGSACNAPAAGHTCSSAIDEDIDGPNDSDFIQSDPAPKASETVELQLSNAPAALQKLIAVQVRTRAPKASAGRPAQVRVDLLKADNTLVGTAVEHTLGNTTQNFSYTISGLSLSASDVNGLFIRVIPKNSGPGADAAVRICN